MYTHNLAERLSVMGNRVVVITSLLEGLKDWEILPSGVEVFRVPTKHLAGNRFPLIMRNQRLRMLDRKLHDIPFDSVIVNTRIYPLSLYGVRFADEKGITPIVIEHGSNYLTTGNTLIDMLLHRYEHALIRKLLKHQVRFYGVSEAAARWLSQFGIRACGVIHNSIDADEFIGASSQRDFRRQEGIDDSTPLVAFTGRLIPEKGVWTICEAARTLASEGVNVKFLIAGDGHEAKKLQDSLPANATLLGRLSREDVASLLLQSDIFCFPTEYPEGLPTSLLEAAACNNYLICTEAGGVREIIPNTEYGVVLSRPYADNLADAIRSYAQDPESYSESRERTKQRVRKLFSWERAARDALQALEDAQV